MRVGGRVTVRIADGPYRGTWARVDRLMADAVLAAIRAQFVAYEAAEGDDAMAALQGVYGWFVAVGRPVWVIEDGRGPVDPTVKGMLRLPLALCLALIERWVDTFPEVNGGE